VTFKHFCVTQQVVTAKDVVAYDAVRDANDMPKKIL
jgi:hypothetical protein